MSPHTARLLIRRSGHAFIALSLWSSVAVAEEPTAAAIPRTYSSSVSIMGDGAISFEISSPRIPAAELEKVIQSPGVLDTLNKKHLSNLGNITVARACRIGPVFLDPGQYQLGIAISPDRALQLAITSPLQSDTGSAEDEGAEKPQTSSIALVSAATSGTVPVVTVAMLPSDDLEGFAVEVRVGNIRGVTPIDFSANRLIVAMNNTAHELLNPDDLDARIDATSRTLALRLATRANSMTGGTNSMILDTYALALFHSGQPGEAIVVQRAALKTLASEDEDSRPAMVARLRAYQLAVPR